MVVVKASEAPMIIPSRRVIAAQPGV